MNYLCITCVSACNKSAACASVLATNLQHVRQCLQQVCCMCVSACNKYAACVSVLATSMLHVCQCLQQACSMCVSACNKSAACASVLATSMLHVCQCLQQVCCMCVSACNKCCMCVSACNKYAACVSACASQSITTTGEAWEHSLPVSACTAVVWRLPTLPFPLLTPHVPRLGWGHTPPLTLSSPLCGLYSATNIGFNYSHLIS